MSIKDAMASAKNFLKDKKEKLEEKMDVATAIKTAGGFAIGAAALILMLASKVEDDYTVPDNYSEHNDEDVIDITDEVEVID